MSVVQSFWTGEVLSPYEVMCIKSFICRGHIFKLYSYEKNVGFESAGLVVNDAGELIHKSRLFQTKEGAAKGSYAIFSDLFRYKLLFEKGGWWVDLDVICRDDDFDGVDIFYCRQKSGQINNAIMKFPIGHPVMNDCMQATENMGCEVKWGESGPNLLTRILTEYNIAEMAAPYTKCYAIDWPDILMFFDRKTEKNVSGIVGESSFIHLWNEILRRMLLNKNINPPKGSFLYNVFKEMKIEFRDHPGYKIADVKALRNNWIVCESNLR